MGRDLLSRLVFVVWNDVFASNADVVSLNGVRRWQVMALSQSVVCAVGAKLIHSIIASVDGTVILG